MAIPHPVIIPKVHAVDSLNHEEFPEKIVVDGIGVDAFPRREALFRRLMHEAKKPQKSLFFNLNVHIANMTAKDPALKKLLQRADVVFCDGAGIALASRFLPGNAIPTRYANADWIFEMFDYLAHNDCTIYYLGNAPNIIEKAMTGYIAKRPNHSIVGWHHGYILKDATLEANVIQDINRVKPDILFVGFGCPLQEKWIERNFNKLEVGAFFPNGAAMDYQAGKVPRCPIWLGNLGGEWLFRLSLEPKRLYHRYLVGNPWFFSRILRQAIAERISPSDKTLRQAT